MLLYFCFFVRAITSKPLKDSAQISRIYLSSYVDVNLLNIFFWPWCNKISDYLYFFQLCFCRKKSCCVCRVFDIVLLIKLEVWPVVDHKQRKFTKFIIILFKKAKKKHFWFLSLLFFCLKIILHFQIFLANIFFIFLYFCRF